MLVVLVGSHRPSVTIALSKLARNGLLVRRSPSRWLLRSQVIELVHDPENLMVVDMQHTA